MWCLTLMDCIDLADFVACTYTDTGGRGVRVLSADLSCVLMDGVRQRCSKACVCVVCVCWCMWQVAIHHPRQEFCPHASGAGDTMLPH